MDPVQRARCGRVANRGLHGFVTFHAAQAGVTHQTFGGGTRGPDATPKLISDLVGAVDLHVGLIRDIKIAHVSRNAR